MQTLLTISLVSNPDWTISITYHPQYVFSPLEKPHTYLHAHTWAMNTYALALLVLWDGLFLPLMLLHARQVFQSLQPCSDIQQLLVVP